MTDTLNLMACQEMALWKKTGMAIVPLYDYTYMQEQTFYSNLSKTQLHLLVLPK